MSIYIKIVEPERCYYIRSSFLGELCKKYADHSSRSIDTHLVMVMVADYVVDRKTGEIVKNRGVSTEQLLDKFLGL